MLDLKYVIENELFITCDFLPTDRFITYCKDRDVQTSRKQLEQFEKLGIFYPFARVQYPKIKKKIEHIDNGTPYRDLGILKDGEQWSGDTKEEYADFWFEKDYALDWFNEGYLYDPSSRPFQPWESFFDKEKLRHRVESFYSIFQCYTLYNLIRQTKISLGMEWWFDYDKNTIDNVTQKFSSMSKERIPAIQKSGIRGDPAGMVCQAISNRYFPLTQSDRRVISVSYGHDYHDWDWDEYSRNWNAKSILASMGLSIEEVKKIHGTVALDAQVIDPLAQWYGLISFTSVEQKKRLRGYALLAQALYSMEHMLRLFYEDLTGVKLHPPDESPSWTNDSFRGEGITQDELKYLEFLTNQYHLNPRPKLILLVEGDGEYEQFPRLVEEVFGMSFSRLGIEVVNIHGVEGFTGKKGRDKYGAMERFIDYYHCRQTIVFVILDDEARVSKIKNDLVQAVSKLYPKRKVTKEEYIHLWKRNVEFDNFSPNEIAQAMTLLSENRYAFQSSKIEKCVSDFDSGKSSPLSTLYKEKLNYGLDKPKLLKILFDLTDDKLNKKVTAVLKRVIELVTTNHQPITQKDWERNQESGFFGDLIE